LKEGAIKVTILNPKHVMFEGEAASVFLPGEEGEFELLDYHSPLISLLGRGSVVVDWKTSVPIRSGIVKFNRNECVVLVED